MPCSAVDNALSDTCCSTLCSLLPRQLPGWAPATGDPHMPAAEACCTFAWGLLGDQLCQGQLIDSAQKEEPVGWNPPLDRNRQQLTVSALLAHSRQLAVGWSHALLLLSDGQLLVCPASAWRDNCQAPAAAAGSGWQPLQLPTSSCDQQQLQSLPPRAPVPSSLIPSQKVVQVSAGDEHFLMLSEAGSVWACSSDKYGQSGCRKPAQGEVQQSCRSKADPSTTAPSWPTGQHSSELQEPPAQQQTAGDAGQHPQDEQQQQQQQQRRQRLLQLRERQRQHEQQQQVRQQAGVLHEAPAVQQHGSQQPAGHLAQAILPLPVLVLGPGADNSTCQGPVLQVAAGACHSAAVTRGLGRLYCWGWNLHGQCCTGSTVDVLQPQLCEALDGVPLVAVAAGLAHTVCVSRDGAVYACGWNCNGQLGTARPRGGVVADAADAGAAAAGVGGAAADGTAAATGLECVSSLRPVLVEHSALEQEHVTQVACGARHTLVVTASGAAYAWGWNRYGQCCSGQAGADVLLPTRVLLPPNAGAATSVHAGRWHSSITVTTTDETCG